MIAAVIIGFVMRLTEYNDDTILLITFPGKILMRPFSLIFLPLVVSSIISGVVQMGQKVSFILIFF
jgi:Na+/H+-dicarboxylate symporter